MLWKKSPIYKYHNRTLLIQEQAYIFSLTHSLTQSLTKWFYEMRQWRKTEFLKYPKNKLLSLLTRFSVPLPPMLWLEHFSPFKLLLPAPPALPSLPAYLPACLVLPVYLTNVTLQPRVSVNCCLPSVKPAQCHTAAHYLLKQGLRISSKLLSSFCKVCFFGGVIDPKTNLNHENESILEKLPHTGDT